MKPTTSLSCAHERLDLDGFVVARFVPQGPWHLCQEVDGVVELLVTALGSAAWSADEALRWGKTEMARRLE
jgi:hypothetical protein